MIEDPWEHLKKFTSARIALGRAGGSLPTRELLKFQLAHANARDAVHWPFDGAQLAGQIKNLGPPTIELHSAAGDRTTYLQRPDLGRRLDDESRLKLQDAAAKAEPADLVIVVSDGLSALAAHRQVVPVLESLLPLLLQDNWKIAPIVLVRHGRVAIEDEIGVILGTQFALMLLGERPGLGSPDGLGAYLVYGPRPGLTDAQRNCVSNIRPEGLPPPAAARTLHYLLTEARARKLSGVALKDESPKIAVASAAAREPARLSNTDEHST